MGPVRQNPIQRTVSLFMCVCASHCAQLLHTILHRTDLIVFPLTLQTIGGQRSFSSKSIVRTHTHTHRTDYSAWTTEVVSKVLATPL